MSNIIFAVAFSLLAGICGYRIGTLRERWHQSEKTELPRWQGGGTRKDGEIGHANQPDYGQWDYKTKTKA